jgi:DNA replication ATP-dependent helicase Dna2
MARFNVSPSRIARYFFHECDRYLRYVSTPKGQRAADGVPSVELDHSLVTKAILQGGYDWEERVLDEHLGDIAIIAEDRGQQKKSDRKHSINGTLAALAAMEVGDHLYQPTLRPPPRFYERYRIDPDLVQFSDCYPDLLTVIDGVDGPEIAVIDVKASDMMKLAHRIQVGLYALILRDVVEEAGLDLTVSMRGGVWLFEQPEPEWFDLVYIVPPLETFLEDDVTKILEAPAEDAFWHLYFRCEWCDYYSHCRTEAEETDSISLIPYMSNFGKRHLNDQDINTVAELADALTSGDGPDVLAGSASLEGREEHLLKAIAALDTGEEQFTEASSLGMPRGENIRVVLTLQSDPLSGAMYGYAINRLFGKDLYGSPSETIARVAGSGDPDVLAAFNRGFVADLMAILRPVHDHNDEHEGNWAEQLAVQAYVFDTYERGLLTEALLDAVLDPYVAEDALALLFYFQRPELTEATDHPDTEVFFPVVVLSQVVRTLFALPIPVAYRFHDVVSILAPTEHAFAYEPNDFYTFELSNRMKSNAILEVWQHDRDDIIPSIERELKARVWAAGSVINGIRERLEGTPALFAWPPKFTLPGSLGFKDPTLSRLAFIARYEQVLGYLDIRGRRTAPESDRLASEYSLRFTYLGDGRYRLDPGQVEAEIDLGDFPNFILTRDTPMGKQARLAYHDFAYPKAFNAPKNLDIALAAVIDRIAEDVYTMELRPGREFTKPGVGDIVFLEKRFTDWNSERVVGELSDIDTERDPWFVRLLRDPVATMQPLSVPAGIRTTALGVADAHGLTPSQREALGAVLDHDTQVIWGPPGTGKTHFLAMTVLAMLEAHRRAGRPYRVLVTAFTHTAIDNLLAKIRELQEQFGIVGGRFAVRKAMRDGVAPVLTIDPKGVSAFCSSFDLAVVGATIWQARKTEPDVVSYDLVVVDEGSQLKVTEAAMAARRMKDGGRLVIAGDDLQLPPIVQGEYPMPDDEPPLHLSILGCLRAGDPDGEITSVLLENFRMNDVLCSYPAGRLYPTDYRPATVEISRRRLDVNVTGLDEFVARILDPAYPMALCVLEDVKATSKNPVEASLVADAVMALRDAAVDDDTLWDDDLFIVSPHHAQIKLIRQELRDRVKWDREPFVDTVDRMQGQERDAVIVSYGVSDVEHALREKEFIYQLNRLNVSITRARSKTIVFMSRTLLEPPIQALDIPHVADGIAYMQGLMHWIRDEGETIEMKPDGNRVTVYRR